MAAYLVPLGRFGLFSARVLRTFLFGRVNLRLAARHLQTVLLRSVLPVMAVVFPFGMVMALQGLRIFDLYGAQRLLSPFVAAAIIRELSPVMASTLVAAQGDASFAAELGTMRVKEELDATDVMGVDSVAWHVTPRVLGITVAAPLLNIMGIGSGILGGYLSAVIMKGEPSGTFIAELWELTTFAHLAVSILKTTVFGFIIGLLSCFLGYHVSGGAAGVGKAVNQTVVYSILAFIGANYLLTSAFFGV